ncbi:hypothetical protein FB451DRAFT_1498503 [Mycena latifolia]|nr:hypothetical protein FB451DRAFT_1498503 [Mycena latifolia]
MSRQPSVAEIRLTNTIACLAPAVALLNELSDAFGTPFVLAISNTTLSLITAVQTVKKNKEDCIQLLENVYQLLCAIVNLHIKSETKGNLPPATLDHVGKFTETLHKIYTFVEAQQDASKIKSFFRQTETKTLHSECRAGLQQAFEVFKMQQEAEIMHKEVLELISILSDGMTSERSTRPLDPRIVKQPIFTPPPSLNSISMLPAKPKIFHGRETELKEIVDMLHHESPRIAILGAGGMGKTILAKAALHYPAIPTKYEHCFFVVADAVTTCNHHERCRAARQSPVDSPISGTIEALVRSGCSRHVFAIAEDMHDSKEVDDILSLTDNMPLAVDLMAHAVDFEGSCSAVLARWKSEKTSLLSAGSDRKSNLDTSIAISLSSPRMTTGAKDLLSLLSILPDGLSDVELVQSKLSIQDIMSCKATLLATSLAYMDNKRRLRSLVPIREHMQCFYPPSPLLIHPLQKYFHQLLDLYQQYPMTQQGAGTVKHLLLNARNMGELLLRGLNRDDPNLAETINCTLSMKVFMLNIDLGYHLIPILMDQIEAVLPGNCNEKFRAQLILWKFESSSPCLSTNADVLITQAISHFHKFNDLALECRFYLRVGLYYFYADRKLSVALEYLHKALHLAKFHGDMRKEASVLNHLGVMKWVLGDYPADAQASYRLAEIAGDLHHQSLALRTSASCYHSSGDIQNAVFLCQRAQKLLELCGSTTGSAYRGLLQDLAEAHLLKSEYAEARNIYMQLARDAAPDASNNAWSLLNIAQLDMMIGASKQDVLFTLNNAMALFDAHSYKHYNVVSAKIYCNIELGKLHLREGEIPIAKCILQACFTSIWGNDVQGALSCIESFAIVKGWPERDLHWASGWAVVYLGYAKKFGDKIALQRALQFLGDVFQAEGDCTTSTSLFTVALEGFTWMDIHRSRAECMLRLGDLAKGQGDVSKATELWKTARPLFERSLHVKQVVQIDERLATITNNVLEETMDSLTHLGQLNAPIAAVPEETYRRTQAGEMEGEGGEPGKDKELVPILV